MKYALLLTLLLVGCEGCVGTKHLPLRVVPDTRAITQLEMTVSVKDYIWNMHQTSMQEGLERLACMYGRLEDASVLREPDNQFYIGEEYLRLVVDSISPARILARTYNSVTMDSPPCDKGSVGTIHTHLLPGYGPSGRDISVLQANPDMYVLMVVDDSGIDMAGRRAIRITYALPHGERGEWITQVEGG